MEQNDFPLYVLKLFKSGRKHQMRYGRNGYLTLTPRAERTLAYYFGDYSFVILATSNKVDFMFYVCKSFDIGFSILGHCRWHGKLPIHVLYRFKIANDCVNHVVDDYNVYSAVDL